MDPAELGRVDVELKISGDGSVRAHLAVERTETLDMLMRDQRGLERALDAAGLKLESGSVQLSLRDQGGFSGFAGSDTSAGSGASGGETDEMTTEADGETAMVSRVQVTGSRGALDIQI